MKTNDICKDCVKWEAFKEGCWVFWEGKKFCTQKVNKWEVQENDKGGELDEKDS